MAVGTPHRIAELLKDSSAYLCLAPFLSLTLSRFSTDIQLTLASSLFATVTAEQSLKPPPYVLLDLTHRDSKTRSRLEIVECRDAIWRDVFSLEAGLGELVKEGKIQLGAF
jgi:hypothetical protein